MNPNMWRWNLGQTFAYLLTLLVGSTVAQTNGTLLWASSGGGWRAMSGHLAYANLFRQAGLFDANSTEFDAVSTISGSSWSAIQMFYSEIFYQQTVLSETPEELGAFVELWFDAWAELNDNTSDEAEEACKSLQGLGEGVVEQCELILHHEIDWAGMMHRMFEIASTAYGDPSFVETTAIPENRIDPVSETDMLILSTLAPNSRVRSEDNTESTVVYLGYKNELLAVPVAATWIVEDSGAGMVYGTTDLTDELQTFAIPTTPRFRWRDWKAFNLKNPSYYPEEGKIGSVTIPSSEILDDEIPVVGILRDPFGGLESSYATSIAAASSSSAGYPSSLQPSLYAQFTSGMRDSALEEKMVWWGKILLSLAVGLAAGGLVYWIIKYSHRQKAQTSLDVENDANDNANDEAPKSCCARMLTCCVRMIPIYCCVLLFVIISVFVSTGSVFIPVTFQLVTQLGYQENVTDGLSVCSQWPNPCGIQDAEFTDGWFVDPTTLVNIIGHHLQKNGVNNDEPLKVILTNEINNGYWNSTENWETFGSFFDSQLTKGIPPGGFLWRTTSTSPNRSPQIFEEYIDLEGFNNLVTSIPESNMTTLRFQATTIDNPAFGIVSGQTVDVLVLNLNADNVPTALLGASKIRNLTNAYVDMVNHVAFNEVLLERVIDFVYEN